jgi:two-component system LytT family sensor kinase
MTTIDLSDAPQSSARARMFAIWTAAALLYATVLWLQVPIPLPAAVLSALQYFYSLGLLMIPVRRVSARLMSRGASLWRLAAVHIGMGIVVIAVWQAANVLFHWLEIGPDFWQWVYKDSWLFQLLSSAVIYVAAVGITLASQAIKRDRARERREHEVEVAARDAELAVLKAQFQPHFVLNALNSLLALIDKDPALARTMVVRLADLMKSVFDRMDTERVPFERELDLVRAYLDVERIRIGSRLSVTFDIDDAARGVLVPPFLLQPLVENAVKHGIAPHAGPGHIDIRATISQGELRVVVRDSGRAIGYIAPPSSGTGRGLQITRRRLDGAYGDGYRMVLAPAPDGTSVEIDMPAERLGVA